VTVNAAPFLSLDSARALIAASTRAPERFIMRSPISCSPLATPSPPPPSLSLSLSLCLSRVSLIYRACSRFSLRRSPFRDTVGASAASAVLLNFLTEPRREQRHGSSHCPFIKIQIPYYRSLLRPACTKSRPIGFVAASDESAHAFRYKTGWIAG